MRRCAFLSTDDLDDFVIYDELTYPHFADLGWTVDAVPWRSQVDWGSYELVVIRSPWDYQDEPERFVEVLVEIDRATRLHNGLEVVRWNLRKDYLRDLAGRGVAIVPSLFRDAGEPLDDDLFEQLGARKIVVKPQVSANADHTYVLDPDRLAAERAPRAAFAGAACSLTAACCALAPLSLTWIFTALSAEGVLPLP
ncbi:MAG: hypothetical protein AAFY88_24025, partial [Acidobacteriota bacterium]